MDFQVIRIVKTADSGVLIITLLKNGEEIPFVYHPDDQYGFTPQMTQWLADNVGSYTIEEME